MLTQGHLEFLTGDGATVIRRATIWFENKRLTQFYFVLFVNSALGDEHNLSPLSSMNMHTAMFSRIVEKLSS